MTGNSTRSPLTCGRVCARSAQLAMLLALAACGGHGKGSGASADHTIGGTISGLTSGSVVLVYNSSVSVTVSAGTTTWAFAGSFPSDDSYAITVLSQPVGELCSVVSGGTGVTLTADVKDVTVSCSTYGQWIWQAGSNSTNTAGVYGTQGAAAAGNMPGSRYAASSWTDSAGNFWLFGGYGYDAAGVLGALADLWQYNPSTALWTWISGPSAANALGVYGTLGTAAVGNAPGARQAASAWIDSAGNLWLFGGLGEGASGAAGTLNDLWRFNPGTDEWTWISGASAVNATGVYGTQGTAAASSTPGARQSANAWVDSSGTLWLFGGYGNDSTGSAGNLNDLWAFSPSTAEWTWVNGAPTRNAAGVYGTLAVAAVGNGPGARQGANAWSDSSGNLWLFGGYGHDSASNVGDLNDLWQYSTSSGEWTWVGGSQTDNAAGVYGVQGTAAASNQPGARQSATAGIDSSGTVWLFGGSGYSAASQGDLNDLWQYSSSTGQWTWVAGGSGVNSVGQYGKQGTVSADAVPGGRQAGNSWFDASGKLWLFGGAGYSAAANGYLNDFWQFIPP